MKSEYQITKDAIKRDLILDLYKDGDISPEIAAKRLNITIEVLEDMVKEAEMSQMPIEFYNPFKMDNSDLKPKNYLWDDRYEILSHLFFGTDKPEDIDIFSDFVCSCIECIYPFEGTDHFLNLCGSYLKMLCWFCVEHCPDLLEPEAFKTLLFIDTEDKISIVETFLKEQARRGVQSKNVEYYQRFTNTSAKKKYLAKRRILQTYDRITFGIDIQPIQEKLSPLKEYVIARSVERVRDTLWRFVKKGAMTESEAKTYLETEEKEIRDKIRKEGLPVLLTEE